MQEIQKGWPASVARKMRDCGFNAPEPMAECRQKVADCAVKCDYTLGFLRSLTVEEVAMVAAFSADYTESRMFADAYCKVSGIDAGLFKKAVYGASARTNRFDDSYGRLVAMHLSLLSKTAASTDSEILPFISSNALGGFSPERIPSYGMRWMMVGDNMASGYPQEVKDRAGCDRERLEMYMDAQLGFVITYRGIENALCSLWPADAGTLMIHQLQGVRRKKFRGPLVTGRHHSAGLNGLDFRKAMVDYAAHVAREAGFGRLSIRGGINNTWTNTDDDGRPHITLERAEEIYDATAQRLGFSYDRNGNWYKSLCSP